MVVLNECNLTTIYLKDTHTHLLIEHIVEAQVQVFNTDCFCECCLYMYNRIIFHA